MKTEKIKGTKDVAIRFVNAENRFIAWVIETCGCTAQQAEKVLKVYRKAKAVKIDCIGGQFQITHGAFCDAEVMRRAIAL